MESRYVTIVLLFVLTLFILIELKRTALNSAETFDRCICDGSVGGRGSACQNVDKAMMDYDAGIATEFTDRKPKGWTTVSPGDMKFPVRSGCCGAKLDGAWSTGDFTDFGSGCN
jgi:hypothetical protein